MISIPIKTPEALAELNSRQRKLSQRQRTVLLLVDGRRAEGEVRQMAEAAGASSSCFDELIDLGMITRPAPLDVDVTDIFERPSQAGALSGGLRTRPAPLLTSAAPDSEVSLLPAAGSLQTESDSDQQLLPGAAAMDAMEVEPFDDKDAALEEARAILLRAVRAEAPVAGSLTLLRLRRARTREDLESLLEEVESRIFKPFKGLWASQTMARVRELLSSKPPLSLPY